jgi:hypothetical protein
MSRVLPIVLLLALAGCDSVFGSKDDPTTDEIFEVGRSEPTLLNEVEYVPLFPFFEQGASGGGFSRPTDVYAGYDELLYVTDDTGLHILDIAGRPAAHVPIAGGATSVVQDRRLRVYVTARRDTTVAGGTWNLPVVIRFDDVASGNPRIGRILWHPFDDDSRRFNRPDPVPTDLDVSFTGVGVLPDNHIYVSRQGPVNERGSVLFAHNIVLEFDEDGNSVQAIVTLSPTRESLVSSLFPTDVATFVQPPQRSFFAPERHFLLAQSPGPSGVPLRFSALSVRVVETPNGREFQPDAAMVQSSFRDDVTSIYDEYKFGRVSDLMFAADGTSYLFVLDAGEDSLHVFTSQGIEGVAPPPGSTTTRPVNVSFGGTGDGATQFRSPQGVAYFRRIVYVADTGNGRISRFRLNTDFE